MSRKNSAVDALRKLEADREALAARQRELEKAAALELGGGGRYSQTRFCSE